MHHLQKILLWIFLFSLGKEVNAQQTFTGEYTFNGRKGQAKYDYISSENGQHIKNGNFTFSKKSFDPFGNNLLLKTEVSGRYVNDLKVGIWKYLEEEHRIDIRDVDNFEVKAQLNSQQIQLISQYDAGFPHGNWSLSSYEFVNEQLTPKAQADLIRFSKGEIVGEFQYKEFQNDRTYFINGKLNSKGLMDGEWTLVYEEEHRLVSEVRKYEKGMLLGLVVRDLENGEVLREQVYYKTIQKLKEVQTKKNLNYRIADERFDPVFNDGFLSNFDEFSYQQNGNQFINSFLLNILRYDPLFVNNKGELLKYPFYTQRFVYEIPKDQHQYLVTIPEVYRNAQLKVNNYAQNSALKLHQMASQSLSECYAFFQFYQQKIKQMQEMVRLFESQDIQYVDLNYLKERDLPGFTPKDIFQYAFLEQMHLKSLDYPSLNGTKTLYAGLHQYLLAMEEHILSYQKIADQELKIIAQNEQLIKLENQILQEKEVLDAKYLEGSYLNTKEKELFHAVHQNIVEEAYKGMSNTYVLEKNPTVKRSIAEDILRVLKEANVQHSFLGNIYSVQQELDSLYTEEVFNPFTYTRYDQRVKERLYFAGVERLFEYYVSGIKTEKDINRFGFWKERLERLTQRMLELRAEDTRRLERRMNKGDSVSKIESMLGL
jgi:hypothetical protein